MKRLYVIRHAKSRKDIPGITDRQRPLSKKGAKAAKCMGRCLRKRGVSLAAFYSSPAKRALDTARLIAKEVEFPCQEIKIVNSLYDSNVPRLIKAIKSINDLNFSAVLFGHNPEFLELVNYLTPRAVRKFPTGGVFGIDFDIDSWRSVGRKKGKIVFSERPKK
jgi:phosphohistidine phosphatase